MYKFLHTKEVPGFMTHLKNADGKEKFKYFTLWLSWIINLLLLNVNSLFFEGVFFSRHPFICCLYFDSPPAFTVKILRDTTYQN